MGAGVYVRHTHGSTRVFTTVVLAASAFVQLASLAFVGTRVSGGDAATYISLALDWTSLDRLLSPEAFEGNFWPAGYSGFLSLGLPFGDYQLLAVRLSQIAMVLAIAWLSADIVGRVSEQARRWTLVITAFSPTLIWGMWAIGYELLLGLLVTGALWLAWSRSGAPARFALAGLAAGLALVVQFRAITVLPVLLYMAWRIGRSRVLYLFSGLAVPIALWSVRSWIATGSPAPWSSNGGYNLWDGNGPHATGHNVYPLPPIPESASSQASAALDWIISQPSQFMELAARKTLFLFYPTQVGDISDRLPFEGPISVAQWIYSLIVLLLIIMFFGAIVWKVSVPLTRLAPAFWVVVLFLVPNIFFIVEARFRIPVEGLVLAVATATAVEWVRSRGSMTQHN